jgi:predicted esterase
MRPLRLLCLHGFRGSGAALSAQMRGFVTGLEPELELLYVDAPTLADGRSGWWNAVSIAGAQGPLKHYEGWQRTQAWLAAYFEAHGPFDGIFGFSQGAALAGLLVGMRAPGGVQTQQHPFAFGFGILVGGFVSNDPAHASLYVARESFALPSLHVIGRADRIVPTDASRALAARFEAPLIVEHDGGHVIPSGPEARAALAAFLKQQRPDP